MLNQTPDTSDLTPPQRPLGTLLSALPEGTSAIVSEIVESPSKQRCMEIGLVVGAHLRVLQSGDPTLLNLNGCRIALSRRCLDGIFVEHVKT